MCHRRVVLGLSKQVYVSVCLKVSVHVCLKTLWQLVSGQPLLHETAAGGRRKSRSTGRTLGDAVRYPQSSEMLRQVWPPLTSIKPLLPQASPFF